MENYIWIFIGAVACLFCYVMGYCIGEAVTNEKWRNTRGQMELGDEPDFLTAITAFRNIRLFF